MYSQSSRGLIALVPALFCSKKLVTINKKVERREKTREVINIKILYLAVVIRGRRKVA